MIDESAHVSITAVRAPSETKRFVLVGGPCDGMAAVFGLCEAWPRYLDGGTAEPIPDGQAHDRLRAATTSYDDRGVGVYIRSVLPRGGGPGSSAVYLHSSTHTDPQNVFHLVAHALTGSPTGRALGGGRDLPEAVLAGLIAACDGLIRLRLAYDRDNRRPIGWLPNPTTGELELCWLDEDQQSHAGPRPEGRPEGGDPQ